ncbi:MAG TPA: GldG family protein [Acidiferrobacterales bacterium]
MRASRESLLRLRLASTGFVLLLLAAVGLTLFLTREYHQRFDWTHGARQSLSEASLALLEGLDQPIRITAFATEQRELRRGILDLVERYQRRRPDIVLEFVDPDKQPARVRETGIRFDGELVVEYGGAKESLSQASEEALTNALARLGRGGERWIVFLGGHGERSPDRQANHDLSDWAAHLAKRGLKTRSLLLGENAQVPQNTAVLVIAGPRVKLLAGEIKAIEAYLHGGGNLLWLHDPGPLHGLAPVAELLGVEFTPGVIVDPLSQARTGAAPDFVVVTRYGQHPAVRGFGLTALFPEAAALSHTERKGWRAEVLLDTPPSAWAESGTRQDASRYDAGQDRPGPLTLALALTREIEEREQRVVVVGDGDFLSNSFLGNGGNLDLGMNLVNWASRDDSYINVPARSAPDTSLDLSHTAQLVIAMGFLLVLPLALIGGGVGVWWRRRKR